MECALNSLDPYNFMIVQPTSPDSGSDQRQTVRKRQSSRESGQHFADELRDWLDRQSSATRVTRDGGDPLSPVAEIQGPSAENPELPKLHMFCVMPGITLFWSLFSGSFNYGVVLLVVVSLVVVLLLLFFDLLGT